MFYSLSLHIIKIWIDSLISMHALYIHLKSILVPYINSVSSQKHKETFLQALYI